MESASVSETEREYCYYVELGDFSVLRNLSKRILDQEQWSFPTNGRGTMRMRKEVEIQLDYEEAVATPVGDVSYTQTLKLWKDAAYTGVSLSNEVTFPVDEKTFAAFKHLSDNGMTKRRFEIPFEFTLVPEEGEEVGKKLPALLEVDVFFDSEGHYQPWAKIDVETKAILNQAPTFPFPVGEVIEPTAEKSVRDHILNTYFLTRK